MFGIGPPELLVVFLIILILFGAKRLPELARSLGKSINEFKSATQNIKDELDIDKEEPVSNKKRSGVSDSGETGSEKEKSTSENKENLAG